MSLWFVLEASNRDVDIDADSVIMQLHYSWSFVTRVQPDRWETPRHFVVNKPPPPEMIRTQEREVFCCRKIWRRMSPEGRRGVRFVKIHKGRRTQGIICERSLRACERLLCAYWSERRKRYCAWLPRRPCMENCSGSRLK